MQLNQIKIGLIDYNAGNLRSVKNALQRISLNVEIIDKAENTHCFDFLLLPGVGAFQYGMAKLRELGFISPLISHAKQGKPLLGICLGMQLLADLGEEGEGPSFGLGLIPGKVEKFKGNQLTVPHVGWNSLKINSQYSSFAEFEETDVYFVHSYYFNANTNKNVVSWTNYDHDFASIIKADNVGGCQFHPEKSHGMGLRILNKMIRELC